MPNTDYSERIEKFLHEQMTPEENEAFLNDLKRDKRLREEAQMMALLIKEMKDEQAKQDAALAECIITEQKTSRAKTIRLVKWVGSIAAMFILIFGATQLWNRPSDTDALFAEYYSPYDGSSIRGGDDEFIKTELATLYNKVGTDRDLTPVIARLQTIYDNIQSNNEEYADYSYYENDIAWYLALAYIKEQKIDKANTLLKPLADNDNDEAVKLLKAIEAL